MLQHCPLCNSQNTRLLTDALPGYVQGTTFAVYECDVCHSQFISQANPEQWAGLYQTIYSHTDIPGYDRYLMYANAVTHESDPLNYLAQSEAMYYSVYAYLRSVPVKPKRILEIGCGYGYLVYALRRQGFDAHGIDISHDAIAYAQRSYGSYFTETSIEHFLETSSEQYDLIIMLELVEHLFNPLPTLAECLKRLTPHGKILITTPNRQSGVSSAVWVSDLPPVHTAWWHPTGIFRAAQQRGWSIASQSLVGYRRQSLGRHRNLLYQVVYGRAFQQRHPHVHTSTIATDGRILLPPTSKTTTTKQLSVVKRMIDWLINGCWPIRVVSNAIYWRWFHDKYFPIFSVSIGPSTSRSANHVQPA